VNNFRDGNKIKCINTAFITVLKIKELNVRVAIPQVVDNIQVYEDIPPVLILSSFSPATNQN
jgi:hypothetical protein